ncbi:MAG: hypothetical protein ACQER3_15490 [Pseudomonadota bacterium]|nr:hypothetical protein [Serratia fonticola]
MPWFIYFDVSFTHRYLSAKLRVFIDWAVNDSTSLSACGLW